MAAGPVGRFVKFRADAEERCRPLKPDLTKLWEHPPLGYAGGFSVSRLSAY